MIAPQDHARFLDREYLCAYIAGGGAAVKFVVAADEPTATAFGDDLRERAEGASYVTARVDAVVTRIHAIDDVLFAVARQIDWDGIAATAVRRAYGAASHPVPEGSNDVTIESVARYHDVDAGELTRDVNRQLQLLIAHDYAMAHEFRIAMLRLAQAQLRSGQVTEAEHAAVLAWLRGELRQISLLRSTMIFRRIGRHNARQILFSLAHWLATNGHAGLVLELDIRRLGFARRPKPEERSGIYYTKAALLDAYEMLRQLIDNTDELSHCCIVVLAAPEFLTDQARGVGAYQALKLRIFDEVRDRNRDNPYSSLVRVGAP